MMTPAMFTIVAPDGRVPSTSPKLDAYRYVALAHRFGHTAPYRLTFQANGEVQVDIPGLATVIYVPDPGPTPEVSP